MKGTLIHDKLLQAFVNQKFQTPQGVNFVAISSLFSSIHVSFKVDMYYSYTFLYAPTSRRIWNTRLVQDDCAWYHLPHDWSSYEYLIHFQSENARAH